MINSEAFTAWVQQDLIPKLPQRSVVVMDNATFPKQPEMQDALDVNEAVPWISCLMAYLSDYFILLLLYNFTNSTYLEIFILAELLIGKKKS